MKIGNQSTLNDLKSLEQKIDENSAELNVVSLKIPSLGSTSRIEEGDISSDRAIGFFNATGVVEPLIGWKFGVTLYSSTNYTKSLFVNSDDDVFFSSRRGNSVETIKILTEKNTIVDANGFIKQA